MWLPEELDVCDRPLCFFKGVSELKCSFMEENKLYTHSLLLPTSEAHSGGKNSPLRSVSGTQKFMQETSTTGGE